MHATVTTSLPTRSSLPAVLADLSSLADSYQPARPSGPLLRAVIQEALRDGAFAVPRPLPTIDALVWSD